MLFQTNDIASISRYWIYDKNKLKNKRLETHSAISSRAHVTCIQPSGNGDLSIPKGRKIRIRRRVGVGGRPHLRCGDGGGTQNNNNNQHLQRRL